MNTIDFLMLGAKNPEIIRLYEACKRNTPNINLLGFIDNDESKWGSNFIGFKVFGGNNELLKEEFKNCSIINMITGNARIRRESTEGLKKYTNSFINLIHPSIDLSYTNLGVGLYIQENVVLQYGVTVEDHVSIHIGSLIGHETRIGECSFIAHGCAISGIVNIEKNVTLGVGVKILPRLTIGEGSIIGGGAVIIKDVPPFSVVVGNPGKIIKTLDRY